MVQLEQSKREKPNDELVELMLRFTKWYLNKPTLLDIANDRWRFDTKPAMMQWFPRKFTPIPPKLMLTIGVMKAFMSRSLDEIWEHESFFLRNMKTHSQKFK